MSPIAWELLQNPLGSRSVNFEMFFKTYESLFRYNVLAWFAKKTASHSPLICEAQSPHYEELDSMKMTDLFLAELEREAAATRRALERVPDGRYDWKPHEKSMTLGRLAELVARLPSWPVFMINQDELELTTYKAEPLRTSGELVKALDEGVAEARDALMNTTDEHLMKPWRLLVGGKAVSEQPRYLALREGVFNHLAHHRGQLTVYLRLNDAPVPAIYGPSADDGSFD
jgi:uncharacterized damage-inducible protein DinB